ncbi:MAG: hypothetical protein JNM57_04905 [Cyclobacteriaceae bacterium]|nr:hypothetical protein [Cyclobacteriaceae bacterium]
MEKNKTSKKALKDLINDSLQGAIAGLELPKPSKKVKKMVGRNAKKLASVFADMIKRENKKKKKAEKDLTYVEDVLKGKTKKAKKTKKVKTKAPELVEN